MSALTKKDKINSIEKTINRKSPIKYTEQKVERSAEDTEEKKKRPRITEKERIELRKLVSLSRLT